MMNKQAIRERMLALREQLDESTRFSAAQQFAEKFVQTSLFQQSQNIALYLAYDGELDPSLLLQPIWQQGKQCFLPVLSAPVSAPHMEFYSYHPGDSLVINRYGILQPDPSKSELCPAENLDLVLVPLVAFDAQHNRLGMGGGYYDRSFAFLRDRQASDPSVKQRKPYLLGLAYNFQYCAALPIETWDIALDEVWEVAVN